jgi:hypothetical protein
MKPSVAEARKVLAAEEQTKTMKQILARIDALFHRLERLEAKVDALMGSAPAPAKKPKAKDEAPADAPAEAPADEAK